MSTPAPEGAKKPRRPAKIVMPIRIGPSGKEAVQKYATGQGYEHYTEWVRDLIAAEVTNPKHRLKPKPRGQR